MSRTKAEIVAAFGQLLDERPLNKITVKDIVDRCDINRNTFYYHFEDIPSLLKQTIENMAGQIIQTYSRFGSLMDCLTPLVKYAAAHKKAFLHIYRSTQREAFLSSLDQISMYCVSKYVETVTADIFPASAPPEEKRLLTKYYKCTMVGVILDWLDAGMEYDLLTSAEHICNLLSGSGRQAFLRCAGAK